MSKEVIDWLLEPDGSGVDYLGMRDLTEIGEKELASTREKAHREGPIANILSNMNPEGYWEKPGPGYLPKYTSTVWSLILLSQLGASMNEDERISMACTYYLNHSMTQHGQISVNGTPSQTIDCLQGNMLTALMDMGFSDPRMDKAYEWMAMTTTGEGVASMGDKSTPLRYYSGKIGPDFACGANNKLACAWGAVKVMMAFSRLPEEKKTDLINRAIDRGVDFLLGVDPAIAEYPHGYAPKTSGNWWKFGFPVFYITDVLQITEALVRLGYGDDPRLQNTLELIRSKQDDQGRWLLEFDYKGKTWGEYGLKKQPNKWVTLRALRVLKAVEES
ncbi:nitrogen fixation protein NifH [Chloroflexota bacterium]